MRFLFYSAKGFADSTIATAKALGIRIPSFEEIAAYGTNWNDFIQKTWPGIDVNEYKRAYTPFSEKNKYEIIPGANETLESLSKLCSLYVLSKRSKAAIGLRIRHTGVRMDLIKHVFCNEDLQYQKPDPRAVDNVLAVIQNGSVLNKTEIISVGDRIDDLVASVGAGISFVGVLTDYSKKADFFDAGLPEENILESIADLPSYLHSTKKL